MSSNKCKTVTAEVCLFLIRECWTDSDPSALLTGLHYRCSDFICSPHEARQRPHEVSVPCN